MKKTFDEQIFRRSEDFRNWSQEPSHLFRFRVILRFVYLNYSNGQKMTLRCHLRNRRVFYLQVTQSIYKSKFGYLSWIFRANLSSKFRKNLRILQKFEGHFSDKTFFSFCLWQCNFFD